MLSISQIISEVDALVPNPFDAARKVTWLNEINKEFFEFVKIPVIYRFTTVAGVPNYTLPSEVQSKDVALVQVNHALYKSMQYEVVSPGHNFWTVDDVTKELQLNPRPPLSNMMGIVKSAKNATTTFSVGDLNKYPDAPKEYHFAYVSGLCERVAKGMNDVTLANNYGADYRNQIAIAQQNFGNRTAQEG